MPGWLWEVATLNFKQARIDRVHWVISGFTHVAALHEYISVDAYSHLIVEVEEDAWMKEYLCTLHSWLIVF